MRPCAIRSGLDKCARPSRKRAAYVADKTSGKCISACCSLGRIRVLSCSIERGMDLEIKLKFSLLMPGWDWVSPVWGHETRWSLMHNWVFFKRLVYSRVIEIKLKKKREVDTQITSNYSCISVFIINIIKASTWKSSLCVLWACLIKEIL